MMANAGCFGLVELHWRAHPYARRTHPRTRQPRPWTSIVLNFPLRISPLAI